MVERLVPMPSYAFKDLTRFWNKIRGYGSDGCWEWIGSRNPGGYGYFSVGYDRIYAHRFSYYVENKEDPGRLLVLHECNNPPCVNPEHLFLGDNSVNQKHCGDCGRRPYGSMTSQAKFGESEILVIRERARTQGIRAIARSLDVHPMTISNIVNYKTWRHVK
jgi:hypothetical protein